MTRLAAVLVALVITAASPAAQGGRGRGPQGPPDIAGVWTGTWSAYSPARASTPPQEMCAKLSANITQKGDVWEAVFEGDCGRPYKYSITMEGRHVNGVVLFKAAPISDRRTVACTTGLAAPSAASSSASTRAQPTPASSA
jgi:hypothetical protein